MQAIDLERHYAEQSDLSAASLQMHHAILSSALKAAVRNKLVHRNLASDVEHKPHATRQPDDIIAQSWSVEESRAFFVETANAGPQVAAFYALALDSGARKGELLGLKWTDVDLEAGTVAIVRQLVDAGKRKRGAARGTFTEPAFGPTKTGRSRRIDLSPETIRLLREHKREQAELKMKNRSV